MNLLLKVVTKHLKVYYDVLKKFISKTQFEMKIIKTNSYLCFYICIAKQTIEVNMFTAQKSSDFLDQIMKRMDETIGSIGASKKAPKKEENRQKLILKFYRKNFEDLIDFDCANEEELYKEYKRRCQWKVSIISDFQTGKVMENIEEEKVEPNKIAVTLDEVLRPWSKEELTRLCWPDYGPVSDPEIKTKQSRFLSDADLFRPCASTTQKKRVSKYSKPKEAGKKNFVQKEAVLSKPPIFAKCNTCGFNRSKKSLREFVASKSGFRSFNINRSKPCDNLTASTTVKRKLAYKHFRLSSKKQSSEQDDQERAYKKRRFVIEQQKLNKQMTKYTSDQSSNQPDFTCRVKTRPNCFNQRKRKLEMFEERADQKRVVENIFNSKLNIKQLSAKPIDAKYEKSLERFKDKTSLFKDQKSSSKMIKFVPLISSRKRKLESKIWFRNNKLVKKSF